MEIIFPVLNDRQIEKLSDICSDVALLSLASVSLPAIFDEFKLGLIFLGLFITFYYFNTLDFMHLAEEVIL